jgi:alpha-L-fucosidase
MNVCSMKLSAVLLCLSCTVVLAVGGKGAHAQDTLRNFAVLRAGILPAEAIAAAARVVPSPRQREWQERAFTAFVHFGMNTFTNREWGEGTESPLLFHPADCDPRQWVKIFKAAGMRMVILTAKHHDGFCLWPSRYTEHSVKRSPWKNGQGDLVRDVADACRDAGLKFGVYLSPWDRHEPSYGDSPAYNAYFRNQLRELLTGYGDIAEVWFDGACGEGPNGRRQVYDWTSYYDLIRELQPGAVIFGMGPDVRWVGTESGSGRETEWSVIPDVTRDLDGSLREHPREPVDHAFIPGDLTAGDLGSREKILNARSLIWYPAETDVSIRPGWFYHPAEDERVKTPEELVDIFYTSTGRNGLLLLNVPADTRGRIHARDSAALLGMRAILDRTFSVDLTDGAVVRDSGAGPGHPGARALDRDGETYWTTGAGTETGWIEYTFPAPRTFDVAMLREYTPLGQRVEKFRLEVWEGQAWKSFVCGTTIGATRLLRFPSVTGGKVRLVIEESRTAPTISTFGLFREARGK